MKNEKWEPTEGDWVIVWYNIYADRFTVNKVRRFDKETKTIYFHDLATCKLEDVKQFVGEIPKKDI